MSASIQGQVHVITSSLRKVFGDKIPSESRLTKWGPLGITELMRSSLSKFERHSPLVSRTINSFQEFFSLVEQIEHSQVVRTQASSSDQPLLDQHIIDQHTQSVNQVVSVGHFLQHLDTILSYGVLIFRNEDEFLNPLLDQVDECIRILKK